jgi:hypothetical protein
MLKLAALIGLMASTAAADDCPDEAFAYKAATNHVMFKLKSPFSAIFPELGAEYTSVKIAGDCIFAVSSFVDALNSNGAMVRQGFSLEIVYDLERDEWEVSGLTTTGSSPSPSAPSQ